jgi:DNA (cytosine-5)-methyltransferase 1
LSRLGYDVTALDNVPDCLATGFAAGHRTKKWDLTSPYLPNQWFNFVWASPPCTAFSVAGNREALPHAGGLMQAVVNEDWEWGWRNRHNPDVWLILSAMQTIIHVRPTAVAIENVQQARGVMEACLRVLKRYGYRGEVDLLSAEQFGVPQTRVRTFLVAHLGVDVGLPSPTHQEYVNPRHHVKLAAKTARDSHLPPWVSMSDALGADEWLLNTGRDWKEGGGRDEAQTIPMSQPAPTVSAQSGRQWAWLRTTDPEPARWITEPAPTLSFGHASAAWRFETESESQPLTIPQAGRLQGFLDDHPWQGSKTSTFRKIGNAVPPPVAIAVVGAAASLDWKPVWAEYLSDLYQRQNGAGSLTSPASLGVANEK